MMKKGKFYQLFTPVLALALIGCSSDMPVDDGTGGNQNDSKDALYMTVNVQLPVGHGSRSNTTGPGTSSDGNEIGKDYENSVTSVLLVLADKDNKFICSADKSEGIPTTASDGGQVTSVQSVSKSVLSAYYGDDGILSSDEREVNVFVFCNPTDALRRIFVGVSKGDESWHEQVCTLSEDPNGVADNAGIWGGASHQDGFLMSSYEIATKKLPKNFSDWDNFTTKENPFKLTGNNTSGITDGDGSGLNNGNAIKVERSVARFDFKDGSPVGNNTYNVVYDNATDPNCLVQIQLTRMALVNMSKNFYYLRRVSGNGLATDATLCGAETVDNYVVDTDADAKADGTIISGKKYADHFNFCLGNSAGEWTIDATARDQWYHSLIAKVLGKDTAVDDEDTPWNPDETKGDYKIWRYVTENTIPGETSNQKHGISTGVVFKGKMVSTSYDTSSALHKALARETIAQDDDPILYAYGSDLYVRWTEVRAMAIKQGANSPMYKAVFGSPVAVTPKAADAAGNGAIYSDDATSADAKWDKWFNVTGDKSEESLKTFKQAATGAGFTLYQRSDDNDSGSGYYCYYYYWNRHNNNSKPAVMGPMEFGVVRNNVYKLAVTNISRLGHPRISENDPDPENPDNPDEDGDVYLSVSVEVLPWVVRINDIEF